MRSYQGKKPGRKPKDGTSGDGSASMPLILPTSILRLPQAEYLLGLRPSTLPREIREGRLRAHKVAGRVFVIGEDLLAWVRGGPQVRGKEQADNGAGAVVQAPDGGDNNP